MKSAIPWFDLVDFRVILLNLCSVSSQSCWRNHYIPAGTLWSPSLCCVFLWSSDCPCFVPLCSVTLKLLPLMLQADAITFLGSRIAHFCRFWFLFIVCFSVFNLMCMNILPAYMSFILCMQSSEAITGHWIPCDWKNRCVELNLTPGSTAIAHNGLSLFSHACVFSRGSQLHDLSYNTYFLI